MERDTEQADRGARGRRIFESLRRRGESEEGAEVPEEAAEVPEEAAEVLEEAAEAGEPHGEDPESAGSTDDAGGADDAGGPGARSSALPGSPELERQLGDEEPPPPAPSAPIAGSPGAEAAPGAPDATSGPLPPRPPSAPTSGAPAPDRGAPDRGAPDRGASGEASPPAAEAGAAGTGAGTPLPTPRVIAIANQKGGVGKTTTAVNLGAALTELDFRVLVVDLDPQGNATTGLGIDIRNLDGTVYECLMSDTPLEDCIEATSVRNLFVAPSNMDLAGAEIELVPQFSRELKLRRAVEAVKDDYDYVLIDCPPSLGLLTVNGLAAADDVIVPIQCEYYALEGLGQLVHNVNLVRANLNPVLDIRGIVLTMYDARTKLADQVVDEVRNHFGARVYETVVPRTVRLSEAPSYGQPIVVFDSSSRGSDAYRALAREVSVRAAHDGEVDPDAGAARLPAVPEREPTAGALEGTPTSEHDEPAREEPAREEPEGASGAQHRERPPTPAAEPPASDPTE